MSDGILGPIWEAFKNQLKIKMKTLNYLIMVSTLGFGVGQAGITIHGSSTDYQETGGDWQTMVVNDIDAEGGLGSDGYIFFGQFDGMNTSGATGETTTT